MDSEFANTVTGDDDSGETLEESEERIIDEAQTLREHKKEDDAVEEDTADVDDVKEDDEDAGEDVETASEDTSETPTGDDEGEPPTPTLEDRVSVLARELEIERLQREKAVADADIWRSRSDQHAGRYGNILKELETLKSGGLPSTTSDYQGDNGDVRSQVQQAIQQEIAPFKQSLQGRDNITAMQAEEAAFNADQANRDFVTSLGEKHGKEIAEAFTRDFNEGLQATADELRAVAQEGTAQTAAKVTRAAYRSAFADARLKHLTRLSTAAKQVRSEQDTQRRAAKRKVSPTATSKAAQKAAKKATNKQDPRNIDLDQLESLVDDEYGVTRGGKDIFAE